MAFGKQFAQRSKFFGFVGWQLIGKLLQESLELMALQPLELQSQFTGDHNCAIGPTKRVRFQRKSSRNPVPSGSFSDHDSCVSLGTTTQT
jgi:hypothetical protein